MLVKDIPLNKKFYMKDKNYYGMLTPCKGLTYIRIYEGTRLTDLKRVDENTDLGEVELM